MEGRRQRWENRRSQHKKPPRVVWVPAVPSWEKEFCKEIGSIGWEKLLLNKKYIHLYPKVLEWNDSACKEAFNNAKARFWAKKNGVSCDLPLPDPNLYIDEIDSDVEIDLELFQDLESASMIFEVEEDHGPLVPSVDSVLENYKTIIPTGWDDYDRNAETNIEARPIHSLANHIDPWPATTSQSWGDDPVRAPLLMEPTLGWSHSNGDWLGYSREAWGSDYGYGFAYPNSGNGWHNFLGWNHHSSWNNNNVTMCNARAYGYNASRTQSNEVWRNRCTPSFLRRYDARD